MRYGMELMDSIKADIERTKAAQAFRAERIDNCEVDLGDSFVSARLDDTQVREDELKVEILEAGGLAWFVDFATLAGELCEHHTAQTRYGAKEVVTTPSGETIWVGSWNKAPLAKKGLKLVRCLRPAWVSRRASGKGLYGAVMAYPVKVPSTVNYWTGEAAEKDPVKVEDAAEN